MNVASGVYAAFLLQTLVTSVTPGTCHERVQGSIVHTVYLRYGMTFFGCEPVCITVYAKSTPTTRSEHVQHQFDKPGKSLYVQDFFLTSPNVLGLYHFL